MNEDLILCVAPNGAYKTKADHPKLPITPDEIAQCAREAQKAGANMIHLHVREDDASHSLDAGRYLEAICAIKDEIGNDLVIQITTEAAKKFEVDVQMDVVLKVKPEAVSLGLREFLKPGEDSSTFHSFMKEVLAENIWPQIILYDEDDLNHLIQLKNEGLFKGQDTLSVLFVLGRYKQGHSTPQDLIPFIHNSNRLENLVWSVCAFGPFEHQCLSAALAFGGHVRVGFENNLSLKNGKMAPNNAALVSQISNAANAIGRKTLSADNLRLSHFNSG